MKFMLPSRYLIYPDISKLYIVSDSEVAHEKNNHYASFNFSKYKLPYIHITKTI